MCRLKGLGSLWLAPLVLALSACDLFIPVPMPAPSSIPVFHPSATSTVTPRPTVTPLSTSTPTRVPYLTPTPPPCDRASLVSAVSSPPGPYIQPGSMFDVTWRIRNDSPCTWPPGYWLVYASGDGLGGPHSMRIPYLVFSGGEFDLTVGLLAPCDSGFFADYWMLRDGNGINFGVGTSRPVPLMVHIVVTGTPVKPTCTHPYHER